MLYSVAKATFITDRDCHILGGQRSRLRSRGKQLSNNKYKKKKEIDSQVVPLKGPTNPFYF